MIKLKSKKLSKLWWTGLIILALLGTVTVARFIFKFQKGEMDQLSFVGLPAEEKIKTVLPKDAIPAIRDPKFEKTKDSSWPAESLALVLIIDEELRAYPINILNWHEIVNDEVGDKKVVVTFCPLCGTGIAFERVIDGVDYTFGVSGKLLLNNLVMYDHQTESYWIQASGKAIKGAMAGRQLKMIPIIVMKFSEWKEKHSDNLILSRQTSYPRDYSTNPYLDYLGSSEIGILGQKNPDRRLDPKTLVFGVKIDGQTKAYPLLRLPSEGVVVDTISTQRIIIVNSNQKSFQTAYWALVAGQEINAKLEEDFKIKDKNSGTIWDGFSGKGISGPLAQSNLTPLVGHQAFWFTWSNFNPNTEVYNP